VREVMEVKEILPQRREKETSARRDKEASEVNLTGSQGSSEGQSFSSTGPSSLNMCSLTASGLTEAGLVAKALSLSQQSESYSEMGGPPSLIQDTQPPSLMQDSMPSLTLGQALQGPTEAGSQGLRRPSMPSPSLQCRHTLSGKLGSSVPVAVRRALGDRAVGNTSAEDLSSISSCHSNLDNIQPPTLLEELDMDCSLLSVASLPSEAGAILAASGGSTDSASASITSEAIRDMVVPAGNAVKDFQESSIISAPHLTQSSVSVDLAMVGPPSAMEELTVTANTGTLVADDVKGGTFLVGGQEENNDTIADVPDAFDDEETVNEPTLTVGSEGQQDCETIPDLPRDSRQATPAQSGGESSVEPSPVARRKLSPKEKRQQDRDRFLTFTKEQEKESVESNEMEATLTQSRVARLDDEAARP